MDAVKVVWLSAATHALDQEHDHLRAKSPPGARVVFSRILALVKRLADFSLSGPPGHIVVTKALMVPTLPYRIICRLASDHVEILRVFRTAGDRPGQLP